MEASIGMHYQVIAWIIAAIVSLLLMVFITMIFCCHQNHTQSESVDENRQRSLSPPSTQPSTNTSEEGLQVKFTEGGIKYTQPAESKVVTTSKQYTSVNLDSEGQASLIDTLDFSDKPSTLERVSQNEDSISISIQITGSPKMNSEPQNCNGADSSFQSGVVTASEQHTSVNLDSEGQASLTDTLDFSDKPSTLERVSQNEDSISISVQITGSPKMNSEPQNCNCADSSFQSRVVTASKQHTSVNLDSEGQANRLDTLNISNKPLAIEGVSQLKEDPTSISVQATSSPKVPPNCNDTDFGIQHTVGDQILTNQDEVKSKNGASHGANVNEGQYLKESDLKEIINSIWVAREKWYQIGIQLGMSVSDLKAIEKNRPNQLDVCFTDMLIHWLRQGKSTWESLINALKSKPVGYPQLADSNKACISASAGLSEVGSETTVKDSVPSMRRSEEGGIAFRCRCGSEISIIEYLDKKCSCSSTLFPYLDYDKLTQTERYMLEETLLEDTKAIVTEFADLLGSTIKSLCEQKLDPKEIASNVLGIAPSESSTLPVLRTLDIEKVTSICDIIIHLQQHSYISFFNYHIMQHLITKYGTSEDEAKLDMYTKHFRDFCQRSVFEVPQHIYGQAPSDSELLAIKVTSTDQWATSFTAFSETSKFSLEAARTVQSKVAKALGLKHWWDLHLHDASKGCVVLTFALPQIIMDSVKPLLDGLSNIEMDGQYSIHILCGPPGKPYATNVTSDSISLQWTKPEYQGSHSLTHYWIHYHSITDPTEKGDVITTDECVTVEGLSHKGAAAFIFKVKAYISKINEAGVESRESDPILLSNTPLSELKVPWLKLHWTEKNQMPFGISVYPQIVVIREKVYIGGGNALLEKERHTVIVYDPKQDSYNKLTPYTHKYFAMAIVNDNLVLIGGEKVQDNKVSFTNQLGMWSGESEGWTYPLPPMTTACKHPSVTTYKNRWLVVIGGFNHFALSRVEILDISLRQWSNSSPMLTPCNQVSLATIGNMCYLLGGYTKNITMSKKVYGARIDHLISQSLDASSVTQSPWETLPDTPGTLATALALNEALLAVGGTGPDIYTYQPSTQSWVKAGCLRTGRSTCGCAVLSDREVIVAGGGEVEYTGTISGHQKTGQIVDIATLK